MNQAANEAIPHDVPALPQRRHELTGTTPSRATRAVLVGVFTCAIFTGASLIFLVQPMVAKMALPLFGGSPAVWNTSMVFFQAFLLAGYAYAHLSTRMLGVRRQSLVHLALLLLPFLALPIQLRAGSDQPDGISSTLWLLLILGLTAGLPFFVVSTASPILQRWFSDVNHPNASDPYFLYAASNAGSLIALLAYPILVEPNFTLAEQGRLWTGMYIVFVGFCAASAVALKRYPRTESSAVRAVADDTSPVEWQTKLRWIFLAFIPSSLMVGVTGYLSTDVASAPFLWVLPLSIYLVTFILAFASRNVISSKAVSLLLAVSVVAAVVQAPQYLSIPVVIAIAIHLVLLFAVGLLAHSKLAAQRPATAHLTEFYLLISIGGVLGGAFNALVAPVVFESMFEYPIVIVLALLLRPGPHRPVNGSRVPWALDFVLPLVVMLVIALGGNLAGSDALVLTVAGLALFAFLNRPVRFAVLAAFLLAVAPAASYSALHGERTFFGVLKVVERPSGKHILSHGTTVHGIQDMSSLESRAEPLSYYTHSGPIGQVFSQAQQRQSFDQVAVIGLGAGSLAAYGQPGQTFSFFEIDPSVVRIASDPRYFKYLDDTVADVKVIVGDGRLQLQKDVGRYDLLVVDAFSSDSVPVHLLTIEAIQLYFEKLESDGIVALHISNRNLELEPVVAAIAEEMQLAGLTQRDIVVSTEQRDEGKSSSHWVVLARSSEALAGLADDSRWQALTSTDGANVWTDDFSNILSTVKWLK